MVDDKAQIIVAAEATQAPQDHRQLVPMTRMTIEHLGFAPPELLSDAGYFSEAAIREVESGGTEVYCPPGAGEEGGAGTLPQGTAAARRDLHAANEAKGPERRRSGATMGEGSTSWSPYSGRSSRAEVYDSS